MPSSFSASRAFLRVQDPFPYCGCFSHRMLYAFLTAIPHSCTSSVLNCSARPISSGTSQGTSNVRSEDLTNRFIPNDVRESLDIPEWVSTQKQNGEKLMSVSIRSGAQRQLARRPPNVPPHPPPPHSSVHPSFTVRQTAQSTTPPTDRDIQQSSTEPLEVVEPDHEAATRTASSVSPSFSASAADPSSSLSSTESKAANNNGDNNHNRRVAAPAEGVTAEKFTSQENAAASVSTRDNSPSRFPSSSHPLLYSVSRFTEPVKRIILIRNGQSEANEDVAAYVHTPDWRIPLVEEGKLESIAAGRALSELTGDDPVYFYYSPYIRSRQSLRYILQGYDEARLSGRQNRREWWEEEEGEEGSAGVAAYPGAGDALHDQPPDTTAVATTFAKEAVPTPTTTLKKEASLFLNRDTSDSIVGVREDVRLRDGDIGRYTTVEELKHHLLERERYGKFFYRFPFGESGADVCDRVTSFLDAFQRERVELPMNTNVVIITHGLTIRMFIKRWFHLTVDTFHCMMSPPPGSLCTLTRLHHRSCFRLDESCVELMHLPISLNEYNGYKYRNKQLLGSMSSGAPYM